MVGLGGGGGGIAAAAWIGVLVTVGRKLGVSLPAAAAAALA
jgi:hypothetical protein